MSKGLHFHLVNSLSQALHEIFDNGKHADRIINKYLSSNRKWGSRDRRMFAESTYEIVRHKRKLEFLSEDQDIWSLIGAYFVTKGIELPDWEEFDHLDPARIKSRSQYKKELAIEYSIPDWLNQLGEEQFKQDWPALLKALNEPAEVYLRANSLKVTTDQLIEKLAQEDIQVEKIKSKDFDLPFCVKLKERQNVFISKAFKDGAFEMQDAASQMVAPLLDLQPGQRVVDACAGAGGKSLHIAALLKNKGKVIAMDVHDWKLKELRDRSSRAGVDIIETKLIEGSKTVKRLENSFDRILLDVPCSGLGVLRRNPDTKWKLSLEEINRLVELQREIISKYSEMAKSGAKMVYATCSVLPKENEDQIEWFLKSSAGQNWKLEKQVRVWPHKHGFDGFFAAVLVKTN